MYHLIAVAMVLAQASLTFTLAAVTGTFTAVGLGTTDLSKMTTFYSSTFGYGRGTKMSFSGWDEIIMGQIRGGGPTIIPMKFKVTANQPARSVKDLPVKLQFRTPNPKALLEKIVKAGGSAVTMTASTGAGEGTLYAKDLEGYLLEIVKGSSIGLSAVAYGSPNVTASGAFWSHLTGAAAKPMVKTAAWDIVEVPTRKDFKIQFIDFHDSRNTKHLPLKVVLSVGNISGFKKTVKDNGGSLVEASLGILGAAVGLGNDPVNQMLIEMNR